MKQPNRTLETASGDTRQRMIRAALQLFGKQGYSQTSTRAIAEAAGVNEVTLFRLFGNKKGLLFACMESRNATGFSATFEAELTGDYEEDILRMAELQIKDTTANLEMLRLLSCDMHNVPELRDAMLAGGRGNMAILSDHFQRQIDAGVVQPDLNAEVLAFAFDYLFSSGIIFEYLFQGSLSDRLTSQDMIQPLVTLFVRGTQAGSKRS